MDQTVDTNNNDATTTKYSLRPRIAGKKTSETEDDVKTARKHPKTKKGTQQLSKYRRRSANARERSRMREINEAFETLRRVVSGVSAVDHNGEKITKISTLRLAMKYITALSEALRREPAVESQLISSFTNVGQPVTVHSDTSLISSGIVSSNTLRDSIYQPFLGEQLRSLSMEESKRSVSCLRSSCEQSADILKPIEIQCCSFSGRNGRNQILKDYSNFPVLSHCAGNAFNNINSLNYYAHSQPSPRSSEQSVQDESSAPVSEFDDCQTLLFSNIQSLPLQGIPLEEFLNTR